MTRGTHPGLAAGAAFYAGVAATALVHPDAPTRLFVGLEAATALALVLGARSGR